MEACLQCFKSGCENPAEFICKCNNSDTLICSLHIADHIKPNPQAHQLDGIPSSPNLESNLNEMTDINLCEKNNEALSETEPQYFKNLDKCMIIQEIMERLSKLERNNLSQEKEISKMKPKIEKIDNISFDVSENLSLATKQIDLNIEKVGQELNKKIEEKFSGLDNDSILKEIDFFKQEFSGKLKEIKEVKDIIEQSEMALQAKNQELFQKIAQIEDQLRTITNKPDLPVRNGDSLKIDDFFQWILIEANAENSLCQAKIFDLADSFETLQDKVNFGSVTCADYEIIANDYNPYIFVIGKMKHKIQFMNNFYAKIRCLLSPESIKEVERRYFDYERSCQMLLPSVDTIQRGLPSLYNLARRFGKQIS